MFCFALFVELVSSMHTSAQSIFAIASRDNSNVDNENRKVRALKLHYTIQCSYVHYYLCVYVLVDGCGWHDSSGGPDICNRSQRGRVMAHVEALLVTVVQFSVAYVLVHIS